MQIIKFDSNLDPLTSPLTKEVCEIYFGDLLFFFFFVWIILIQSTLEIQYIYKIYNNNSNLIQSIEGGIDSAFLFLDDEF